MTEAELKQVIDDKNAAEIEAANDPLNTEEVQIAAGYYAELCRTIKGYSSVMNGKGLARVMVALAEFPYGDKYPKFRSDAEQKLFTFMLTIQSAKAKIAAAIQPELSKLEEQAVNGIVEEQVNKFINKGEQNGSKME